MLLKGVSKSRITSSSHVYKILKSLLLDMDDIEAEKEHVWVIGLNARLRIVFVELNSLGTLNECIIHPREVFRRLISLGCSSFIIAHNHPSGSTAPSNADIAITNKLKEASKVLDINFLDHLIITKSSFYSFKEKGEL